MKYLPIVIAPRYRLLARYGTAGVCGGLIQTLTLYLWVSVLHLETYYLLGATAGFCAALLVTFVLQKYWTFRDYEHMGIQRQFVLYTFIALCSLGLNVLLLHFSKLLLEYWGLNFFQGWYLVAQVVIIGVLAGLSFIANYGMTFRRYL